MLDKDSFNNLYIYFSDDFNILLDSNRYISKKEYQIILDKYQMLFTEVNHFYMNDYRKNIIKNISNNLDNIINKHNSKFVNDKLIEYKDYFDNIFKKVDANILLDEEQRKAILIDEDYSLVIAGAGSGKTTTMTAKAKYLIEKCHIKPEEIVILSFTDKAVEELNNRINCDFNLGIEVMTFHKLGMKILNDNTYVKVGVIDENYKKQLIYNYFKENVFPNKKLLSYYMDNFSKYLRLSTESLNYNTYDEYYDFYVNYIYNKEKANLKEYITRRIESRKKENLSIQNERCKSRYEVMIANFLFVNGIHYMYEKHFEKNQNSFYYKPDFTVFLPNGKEIYIEFFGLCQFDENGSYSENEIVEYNKQKQQKEELHNKYGTDLIELYPDDNLYTSNYLIKLEQELRQRGVIFEEKTDKEIFLKIMETSKNTPLINFVSVVNQFITKFKCYNYNTTDFKMLSDKTNNVLIKKQLVALRQIYDYYNMRIHSQHLVDFEDMINLSSYYLQFNRNKNHSIKYKYIIVDEFQDISQQRFDLLHNFSNSYDAKIVGVGDDWQAIFGFSGAKIDLFTNFCQIMGYGEIIKITNTYRNSQELIDIAGEFVLKNESQFEKYLHSPKHLNNPIEIVYYNKNDYLIIPEILEKLVLEIYNKNPNDTILLLGRYNKDKNIILDNATFREGIIKHNEIIYVKNKNIKIKFLTIHSAKGLGFDQVILLNALDDSDRGFPSKIKDDPIISILDDGAKEKIEYAEERRLFYVAITRTKNKVYILAPDYNTSSFIIEIKNYNNVIENRDFLEELEVI